MRICLVRANPPGVAESWCSQRSETQQQRRAHGVSVPTNLEAKARHAQPEPDQLLFDASCGVSCFSFSSVPRKPIEPRARSDSTPCREGRRLHFPGRQPCRQFLGRRWRPPALFVQKPAAPSSACWLPLLQFCPVDIDTRHCLSGLVRVA
ncbi:hypothetical protein BGZ61DRAFT_437273 [Ilyonectria robusta]|uniref:uncharacterized protein n=1 Tax=Ilyonectria robusta TaxID=1079257 RepID=UPI001E8CF0AA|nr:uncharacterized protein BGZ61DRAFT_437273 [Ilyonectria robusta]KAH8736909.1 hypothetical protein BGZ61DRAFT_437273 [Ilyonectria robusta]